ncbi:MAG: glycoside hydrolase family 43 protein [Kineosporiaceae bacterium]
MTFTNPVWPGYLGDPFVLDAGPGAPGGRFHAFGTGPGEDAQALVALASDDLLTWRQGGPVLDAATVPQEATHHWAPEVIAHDGAYWLYYSAGVADRGHRLRVACSEVPGGPYADLGVELSPSEPFAIDPHPFRDADGGLWLFSCVDRYEDLPDGALAGTVIVVDRLLTPTRPAGDPRPVVTASGQWQLFLAGRSMYGRELDWYTCEGAFCVHRQGRYWCLYSGGNWQGESYGVGAVVADSPLGPWTPVGDGASVVRTVPGVALGPGHASVLTDDAGTDWLVHHAWDVEGTARRMWLSPLTWTPSGPVVDGPRAVQQRAPVVRRIGGDGGVGA